MTVLRQRLLFLLSPANVRGARGDALASPGSDAPICRRLEQGTLSLGEAFSWISTLYFRAKLRYAETFAEASHDAVLVIAPGLGLLPPAFELCRDSLAVMRRIAVDPSLADFRRPLESHAEALLESDDSRSVVFLGSLARGRYLELLASSFGSRLLVPGPFVGLGQMQRGSLLLRCVEQRTELDYVPAIPLLG